MLLTTGGDPYPVFDHVFATVFSELTGVRPPGFPVPPEVASPVDVARVAGVYRSSGYDVHVTPGNAGRVLVRFVPRDEPGGAKAREFTRLRDDALIAVEEPHTVLALIGRDEHDRVRWLHYGRVAARL